MEKEVLAPKYVVSITLTLESQLGKWEVCLMTCLVEGKCNFEEEEEEGEEGDK